MSSDYAAVLAEIEANSAPKPEAQPPTHIGTTSEGREWLAQNAEKDGVVQLPSGLQYRVLKPCALREARSPKLRTSCEVHYRGTLLDGTEFDSSKKKGNAPATFAPSGVIRGWTIAMQLMGIGDKWMIYVPSELAYGDAGRPASNIPGGAVLIFELELLKILGPTRLKPRRVDGPVASKPTLSSTPSLRPGSRAVSPKPGSRAASPKPGSRAASPKPGTRPTSPKPDSRPTSPKPDSRPASPKSDSHSASPKPGSRAASPKPGSRAASPKPGSRAASPKPTSTSTSATGQSRSHSLVTAPPATRKLPNREGGGSATSKRPKGAPPLPIKPALKASESAQSSARSIGPSTERSSTARSSDEQPTATGEAPGEVEAMPAPPKVAVATTPTPQPDASAASEMATPSEEQVGRADKVPPFIKKARFDGARPGYVFTKRARGVGYYRDAPPKGAPSAPSASGGAAATPAALSAGTPVGTLCATPAVTPAATLAVASAATPTISPAAREGVSRAPHDGASLTATYEHRLSQLMPPSALMPPAAPPQSASGDAEMEPAVADPAVSSCDVDSFDEGVDAVLDAMSSLLCRLEVPTLQAALADLGLPATGDKQSLSERLLSAPNVVVGNEAVSKVLLACVTP